MMVYPPISAPHYSPITFHAVCVDTPVYLLSGTVFHIMRASVMGDMRRVHPKNKRTIFDPGIHISPHIRLFIASNSGLP